MHRWLRHFRSFILRVDLHTTNESKAVKEKAVHEAVHSAAQKDSTVYDAGWGIEEEHHLHYSFGQSYRTLNRTFPQVLVQELALLIQKREEKAINTMHQTNVVVIVANVSDVVLSGKVHDLQYYRHVSL